MSRDSEDKDPRQSQPERENPFIKFRQFADEQISSLLQGIIGLPSAFSKTPPNTRWIHFEDEIRIREGLQVKKKEMNEQEGSKEETRDADWEDAKIPVKKYSGWARNSSSTSEYIGDKAMSDNEITQDLPLYSPVTKSLFAHLGYRGLLDEGPNWSPIRLSFYVNSFPSFTDHMTAVQYSILSDLSQTPRFRSDYSLMPYLLFSPYSPLKLSSDGIFGTLRREAKIHDPFPYCDAFEDLISLSQGQPMVTHRTSINRTLASPILFVPLSFQWLHHLNSKGMLQQKEGKPEESVNYAGLPGQSKGANPQNNQDSPQTEEDMYERFLQLASPSTGTSGLNILSSIFADIEKDFENPESEYGQTFRKMAEQIKTIKLDEERDIAPLIESLLKSVMKTDVKELEDKQPKEVLKSAPNPDKVVSTTTTTIDNINEDGSVKTSIMVRKRFADGRETVTTTEHTEDPARDAEGNSIPRYSPDTAQDASNPVEKRQNGKKGWFWN